jgi:hypothetical protein
MDNDEWLRVNRPEDWKTLQRLSAERLVPTITEARVMRSIKITSRIKHLPVLSHVAFL